MLLHIRENVFKKAKKIFQFNQSEKCISSVVKISEEPTIEEYLFSAHFLWKF